MKMKNKISSKLKNILLKDEEQILLQQKVNDELSIMVENRIEEESRKKSIINYNSYINTAKHILKVGNTIFDTKETHNNRKTTALNKLIYNLSKSLQLELFTQSFQGTDYGVDAFDLFDFLPRKLEIITNSNIELVNIEPSYNENENMFCKKIDVTESKTYAFADTPFISFPWRYSSIYSNLVQLADKEWIQDSNHKGRFFYPINMGFIYNGNHSVMTGILFNKGSIDIKQRTFSAYDISPLFKYIEINSKMEWISISDKISIPTTYFDEAYLEEQKNQNITITYWQLAAIFSISKIKYENNL